MTLPFDCCRLYFYLRNKAYEQITTDSNAQSMGRGIVDLDHDHPQVRELELSETETRQALDKLVDAELVHRLRPQEEYELELADRAHREDALFVEPCDDLTAAIIIFAGS